MSCYGCSENLANQLAHMDFGGCLSEAIETPPRSIEEFFPSAQPQPCVVCITQGLGSGIFRRACPGTSRCLDHSNQCAYCRSPGCESLLCERCSYSAAGNAAITEALQENFDLCLYDRDMSPSESWTCGCPRCIEVATAFYTSQSVETEISDNE
jgi:hypothetical protein